MDIPHQISTQIEQLNQGEQWTFSAQELYMSHNDFNSLSILLTRASEKANFQLLALSIINLGSAHTQLLSPSINFKIKTGTYVRFSFNNLKIYFKTIFS